MESGNRYQGGLRLSTYVLVHGSWHAAWCWYKVVPLLQRAGHKVIAIDLASHGRDRTAPGDVTMQDYVDSICTVLDAEDEPVILVGHSRGGLAITQAAEERPDRIRTLVYLAAFLIPNGETIIPLALSDSDSLIMPNLDINADLGWDMLREEAIRETLYADCSDDAVALARLLLTPEPSAPTNTPIRTSEEGFGRIPRVYIELLQDRAVSPSLQKRMYTAMPCERVISINASHSAYFSAPDELVARLLEV